MLDFAELPDDADPTIVQFLRKYEPGSRFWLTRTPGERLTALEYVRCMTYGRQVYRTPMKKVMRVVERPY